MIDIHPSVIEAASHLRKIPSADFHQKRVCLHHIDLLHILIFCQFPDNAAVTAADDKDLLHIGMDSHGHMAYHFMIYKLILLGQGQVPVYHQYLSEFPGTQHIQPLQLTVGGKKLFIYPDG